MTRDQFWDIIEHSRSQWDAKHLDGNMDRQCELLRASLEKLAQNEVISFATHFEQLRAASYRWDLWAAAYIMGGGCSDDNFCNFQGWLISLGRRDFESALKNPDSLTDVSGIECEFFEDILFVASNLFEEKFEEELPELNIKWPKEPLGEPFNEDVRILKERLPRLFHAYH